LSGSRRELTRMRGEFERTSSIVLPNFLDPPLLEVFQEQVASGLFSAMDHVGFGRDFPMRDNSASQVLNFLLNDPRLLSAVRDLTGCRAIRSFKGSVRRAIAGPGNSLSWHNDTNGGRLVALTLNLGTEAYCGGLLQIRDRGSKRIISEVANTGSGDAVVFRISKSLEHRNSRVLGKVAKTAFSGWFLESDDFVDALQMKRAQPEANSSPVANSSDDARGLACVPAFQWANDSTRLTIPADIVWRRFGEGMVVVKASDGLCYRLDPVGMRIWELVAKRETLRIIVDRIANEYEAPRKQIERDVVALLADLAANQLLTVEPPAPSLPARRVQHARA
jgi:hypothetical protein